MRAGLTLPIKYPPLKGMKSNTQSGIDSGMTLNLLTAVWEYSSIYWQQCKVEQVVLLYVKAESCDQFINSLH